jgi:hypothetical protein
VLAVGMGATSRELRTPWEAMSERSLAQSQRVLGSCEAQQQEQG